jgi:hypothetical protein
MTPEENEATTAPDAGEEMCVSFPCLTRGVQSRGQSTAISSAACLSEMAAASEFWSSQRQPTARLKTRSTSLGTDTGPDGFWFPNQALDFTLDGDSTTGDFDVGTMSTGTFTVQAAPEPASLTLLGSGLVAALGLRRRKR